MDPSQLQPGYRLDRYELLCPLAYGGMASVWLARFGGRLGFERMVVIKMILPQYSQDPRFQEMFLDEARIASKIEHANVARILDVGEDQGNYYIVMEWVDGDSLSKILRAAEQRKEKIPPGVAMRICADAAAGLHAAHVLKDREGANLGVVHRDVSPQNILVANNGSTMIIDFGVAKARDRVSQETSAGQLKGKIRYMAPEQALGMPIDHRADVWAIGAMLYEMFTGNPPYDGPNEVAMLRKLTTEPPPKMPESFGASSIREVVDKALGYEAEGRFATALDLSRALEAAMNEIGAPTTTAMVAQYTAQLLEDRKGARRKAVDLAIEQAHKRESSKQQLGAPTSQPFSLSKEPGTTSSPEGHLTPSAPNVAQVPPSYNSADFHPAHTVSPSTASSATSQPRLDYAQHGLGESPSATSNATLGSANMEYPPASQMDPAARRRRYIGAATLGVFGAAGLVGIVLIISTALMRRSAEEGRAARSAEPPVAVSVPTIPTPIPTPEPEPAPSEAVAAPTPDPEPAPTETAPPPPATTPPVTAKVDPPRAAPIPYPSHKVVPVGTGTGKPGTTKKPDRGF